jgi:hypothetical protein
MQLVSLVIGAGASMAARQLLYSNEGARRTDHIQWNQIQLVSTGLFAVASGDQLRSLGRGCWHSGQYWHLLILLFTAVLAASLGPILLARWAQL